MLVLTSFNNEQTEDAELLGFLRNKSKTIRNGLVGIQVNASGIAVSHVHREGNANPVLKACQFLPCSDPTQRNAVLTKAVSGLGLQNLPVNYVLTPPQYSILLVEQPKVPADEMKQALRWRIKDLVSFDVDTAAIDVVHLPDDAFRGRTMMVYAVAAARSVMDEVEDLFSGTGLHLQSIDVAELAMCNLLSGWEKGGHGIALMHLAKEQGVLNLIKNNTLYLTRNIKADVFRSIDNLSESREFNHLLLETQRSLDYYESQLGQPPAAHLLLTPLVENSRELQQALNSNLGLQVQQVFLSEVVDGAENLSAQQQLDCLLSIAGALRPASI
jgi:MSHA biogenesis protein MshI